MVDAPRCQLVPQAQVGEDGSRPTLRPAAQVLLLGILVVAPEEAGGRQAIADVNGIRSGDDAVTEAALIGQDEVVLAEIELLKGSWIERQVELRALAPQGRAH